MSLESLHVLESRVGRFVELVHRLKRENEALRLELDEAHARLREYEEGRQEWEMERADIGGRIEKVLGALSGIDVEGADELSEAGPARRTTEDQAGRTTKR